MMQRYTIWSDGEITYTTGNKIEMNGQLMDLTEGYEGEDTHDPGAWVRYEDAQAAISTAHKRNHQLVADAARLQAEAGDWQQRAERAESWLKQTEEQVVQQRLRAEQAEADVDVWQASYEKTAAERNELAEIAAFAESGRKEMKAERDSFQAQIAALRAALLGGRPADTKPPCDCCEPCGVGFVSRCECDNKDDACNAQTWCVVMSNFNGIEGVLGDTAAAAEAHDEEIRKDGYRDGHAQALREVRWALGAAHEDGADGIVAQLQSEAEEGGNK